MFVAHPRIAPGKVAQRGYQEAIAAECLERNTLVILPTGLGKTVVAVLVLAERLRDGGRAILLAPTKPLVEQHAASLRDMLEGIAVEALTGEVPPEEREAVWAAEGVVCSTPQVLSNDLKRGGANLAGVRVLVLDEAHRAVGDYAYASLARAYRAAAPDGLLLGMTASPGAQPERIAEVMENLGIEGIEIRSLADPDVAPYVHGIDVQPLEVILPLPLARLAQLLRAVRREALADLQRAGALRPGEPNRRDLLDAQRRLSARVDQGEARELYHLLSALAMALKLDHAVALCETQSIGALRLYLQRLEHDPSRAAKAILRDARVQEAVRQLATTHLEHPKLRKLFFILREQLAAKPASRAIVFAHYRDTAEVLQTELAKVEGLRPVRFVGQASKGADKGLSQKEQQAILQAFRDGVHNILVATSVAEEGLDIPATDLVVFYEPVPSEIRSIQRRGRTGRHRPGQVVVLLTKGTRDVATYWVARRKEQAMLTQVEELRRRFAHVNASWERPQGQRTLADFGAVAVDHRVAQGPVAAALRARGLDLEPSNVPGATFSAGEVGVRVVEPAELASPQGRARIEAEVRALQRFHVPVVVVVGEPAREAEAALLLWEERGVRVARARDSDEGAALVAGLLEGAA
ncbi:MAG TPA: helicase-related protein [Candidatus Thermoplasmatota archaeon]|nr:helicase-related protein [Candidatus Thermoplasmatota archaeon]